MVELGSCDSVSIEATNGQCPLLEPGEIETKRGERPQVGVEAERQGVY